MSKISIKKEHLVSKPKAEIVRGLQKTIAHWKMMKTKGCETSSDYKGMDICYMCIAMNKAFKIGKESCLYCPLDTPCKSRNRITIDNALKILNSKPIRKAAEEINKEIRNIQRDYRGEVK